MITQTRVGGTIAGMLRKILRVGVLAVGALAVVYLLFLTVVYIAMIQPPDRFGRFMAKLPGPLFPAIPFERMWNVARGGRLSVGEEAAGFRLAHRR